MTGHPKTPSKEWFDLVIIDEATQMDVATAVIPVSKAKSDATFVLAGDDLQLPPIHQADPPKGLEHAVGSVYRYIKHQGVTPQPLQVNYRANSALVEFTKKAGYDTGLASHNPDLKMKFSGEMAHDDGLAALLSPDEPAACFIYEAPTASQSNPSEAEVVAGLIRLLFPVLNRQLANELGHDGKPIAGEEGTNESAEFWQRAIGVVTPHRAQVSAITTRLLEAFPGHQPSHVRGAVDTVERFQGQQRDIIIASFGIGDPDLIADEDEFLYNLNRFNVMASRARAKLIVLLTRSLLDHLPRDRRVTAQSGLVKSFAEGFCQNPRNVTINGVQGELRTRRC